QSLGSQAVQDICQRIEKAYQLFFKHNKKGVRPPGFKKVKKYKEWVAKKKNKVVVFIGQWYPSSKTCRECGQVLEKLDLSVREWRCPSCQSVNGRDENAAKNIQAVGASTVSLGDVRQASPAITA
ncbi:zinc ribbon domain-containing protein, partial [Microcoleus sp.]